MPPTIVHVRCVVASAHVTDTSMHGPPSGGSVPSGMGLLLLTPCVNWQAAKTAAETIDARLIGLSTRAFSIDTPQAGA